MNTRIALLAGACVLVLSACNRSPAPADNMPAPAATTPAPMEPATPATVAPAASATMAMPAGASTMAMPADAGGAKPAAVVADCATTIEGNDAMQYNVGSIAVPASCTKFTINLKHVGKMPAAAMGHNVVIAKESDLQGINADGVAAGAAGNYVKAGDARVIAHSKVVGGGESTSVSFDTGKIKSGGPYVFFCSFPGHAAMMKGSITMQ